MTLPIRSSLFVSTFVLALVVALPAHAQYTSTDWGGTSVYAPHCHTDVGGSTGSPVAGGYWDGTAASAPPGFADQPDHFCFWETEKVVNNCTGCGEDTVNEYGWTQFPNKYVGFPNGDFYCDEDLNPVHTGIYDWCSALSFGPASAPPTVSLSANPTSVAPGGATVLTWSSTNATSCSSANIPGVSATSGSSGANPSSTTTYTVTCTGAGGSASASATVTVSSSSVPSVTLTPTPSTVAPGGTSNLTWSSTNATSCSSTNVPNVSATSGSSGVTPSSTTTYTVTCTGPGGSASGSATVTVSSVQGQTASLTASPPNPITSGQTVTLYYTCSPDAPANIKSSGSDSYGTLGATDSTPVGSGSITRSPTQTTTYTLNCYGSSVVSSSVTVTVNAACIPDSSCAANTCTGSSCTDSCGNSYTGTKTCSASAPTVTFTATPNPVASGSSTKLTWSSTNATSCTGGGFSTGNATSNATGVSTGPLTSAATYTITCTGSGGSTTKSVTVGITGGTCTDSGTPTLSVTPNIVQVNTATNITFSFSVPSTSGSCTLTGPGVSQTITATAACTLSASTYTANNLTVTGQSIYTLSCPGGRTAKAIVNVTPNFTEF